MGFLRAVIAATTDDCDVGSGYDCNYGDPTTKFIAWLYSDVTHEALMEHKMAPLPTEGRAAALEVLQAITCDGEFILPHCE